MSGMTRPDFTLTVNCPDQKGIIAAVTHTIAAGGGNILNLSQHTATDINMFLLKADFSADETFDRASFETTFTTVATRFQMEWKLYDKAVRPRVAILVSKTSHCLYELLLKHQDGELECDFPIIVANHSDLASVATQFHIPFFQVDPAKGKAAYEADVQKILEDYRIDTVVLARYMQILSPEFTRRWAYHVINIHHGFLPAFMGAKPYHQAWHRGVKIIGATAHFANENLDQGPIISQDTIQVPDTCSIAEFVQMGKDVERKVLFEALRSFLNRQVFVYGGRTFLLP
jgi:formyltetrahydrofolate deformylase